MISVIFIGLSLSMDAFAVSVTNGLTVSDFKLRHALLMSGYFGFFQFLMPLIGSFLAGMVSSYIESFGPYISFLLLAFIGGRMIKEALKSKKEGSGRVGDIKLSHGKLFAMAVATSIDALAVGVSFAFMDVPLITACLIIGVVTFLVCAAGGLLGRKIPGLSGAKAEIAGGVVLVAIGIKLLVEGII